MCKVLSTKLRFGQSDEHLEFCCRMPCGGGVEKGARCGCAVSRHVRMG